MVLTLNEIHDHPHEPGEDLPPPRFSVVPATPDLDPATKFVQQAVGCYMINPSGNKFPAGKGNFVLVFPTSEGRLFIRYVYPVDENGEFEKPSEDYELKLTRVG